MNLKKVFKGIVILLMLFSVEVYSKFKKDKVCPENPIDSCPKGFLCKNLKPIKGQELRKKMMIDSEKK